VRALLNKRLRATSPETALKQIGTLRRLFRLAIREGHLKTNPVDAVKLPQGRPKPYDFMTPAEVAKCLAKITDQADADLVRFVFHTGFRREELARLTADDVDLAAGTIRIVGKTANRVARIGKGLADVVPRILLRAGGGSLFGNADRIGYRFAKMKKATGERRLYAHALRHSFGTAMAEAGVPVHELQRAMGHKTLSMTMRYVHGSPKGAQAAVDALTLPHAPPSEESQPEAAT